MYINAYNVNIYLHNVWPEMHNFPFVIEAKRNLIFFYCKTCFINKLS